MLCEQTEARGNFIIFTSLAAVFTYIAVLIFQITDEYPFPKKNMLENKLMYARAFRSCKLPK